VYIPESCSRILYELKIQQASDKRHSQGVWLDSGFVFTDKYGKNISLYAPTRICAEVQAKYGLRHLKLHGLRHTCGSLMVEHGVDPETVKTVLGHESLKTTNRYLHPYAESMKDASEKMERIIRGKTDGETPIHLSGGE
jgi:integrase family protein